MPSALGAGATGDAHQRRVGSREGVATCGLGRGLPACGRRDLRQRRPRASVMPC
jgi:hypothetical protein